MPDRYNNRNTVIVLVGIVVFMLALSFASVPLYRIFCQQTGYGGTTRLALSGANRVENRKITLRFNADVNRDLPWVFKPLQNSLEVQVGATSLAFYQVKNTQNTPISGIAVYNVTPDKAAVYFNKIHCFCFEEQTIAANAVVDMPVQFFIDPEIVNDKNCDGITTITLSYTFFNAKDPNIPAILGLPNPARHQMREFNNTYTIK